MGIRFLCESCGKKLNVKSFLAGKRGVCPHCGGRVQIPMESQLPEKAAKGEAQTKTAAQRKQVAASTNATDQKRTATQQEKAPQLNSERSNGSAAAPIDFEEVDMSAVSPDAVAARNSAARNSAAQTSAPQTSAPRTSAPRTSTPRDAEPAVASSPASSVPRAVAIQDNDPIADAPDAVWYVRPPSGGQFGPANADIMRKWIDEGRVSADSLVWREGWADWQMAGPLFPKLSQTAQAAATPPTPVPSAADNSALQLSGPANEGQGRSRGRKKSNKTVAITSVVVLAVASIVLIGLLIAVLVQNS